MTSHTSHHLIARHLRFHHQLLALWRHTAALPQAADPAAWTTWIERRQLLLDRVQASDAPRVMAETNDLLRTSPDDPLSASALCAVLRALQERGLAIMQSLLSLESAVLRLLSGRRLAVARRLLSAHRAHTACATYRRGRRTDPPPDSGAALPVTRSHA